MPKDDPYQDEGKKTYDFYKVLLIGKVRNSLKGDVADREVLLPIKLMLEAGMCGIDSLAQTDGCQEEEANSEIERFLRFVHFEAKGDFPLLIIGESGTGKDTLARVIHNLRDDERDFVAINCAAIPPDLLEYELFGYDEGAFLGAMERKRGVIEISKGGSCYIDQLGKMPPYLQFKLLSVLEHGKFVRSGGTYSVSSQDVKFIISLQKKEMGDIVSDLLYRLNPYSAIHLPSLRERLGRNPYLIYEVFDKMADKSLVKEYPNIKAKASTMVTSYDEGSWIANVRDFRKAYDGIYRQENLENRSYYISEEVFEKLRDYDEYDGNLRELENIIKYTIRSAYVSKRDRVLLEDLPPVVRNHERANPEDGAGALERLGIDTDSMSLLKSLKFAEEFAREIKTEIVSAKLAQYMEDGYDLEHVLTKIEGVPEHRYPGVIRKIKGITGQMRKLGKKA